MFNFRVGKSEDRRDADVFFKPGFLGWDSHVQHSHLEEKKGKTNRIDRQNFKITYIPGNSLCPFWDGADVTRTQRL